MKRFVLECCCRAPRGFWLSRSATRLCLPPSKAHSQPAKSRGSASLRFRPLVMAGALLFVSLVCGCRKPAQPVTLTFLDPESQGVPGDHRMISDVLQEFTQQTGIRVDDLPTPEDNGSKLDLALDLLRSGATSPDVYGVDTIWAGAMAKYLLDLQPYFASEIAAEDPELIASYMVQGKL